MEPTRENTPHINVDYFEDLTGEISPEKGGSVQEIGPRIKALREEKQLSLQELAEATGFDSSYLQEIETGKVQPQLGTIIKLSKALDAAFSRLISGPGDKPYAVTRKSDRQPVSRTTTSKGNKQLYSYLSLDADVQGRNMEALIVKLEENPEEETSQHQGEEFIFVLDGQVAVKLGEDRFELEPGDSVYYLSTVPHLVAAKQGQATILAVLHEG
ncbi:helix-turn-helix domain-containing protein [Desulfovermiculus halophilus]|uniref:helix-turn-helix domain-containing protein n=1 Tax=Desulfovermiculus halophilus TaxID=339722 RepID=UPI00048626A6|nr:XRE family transcriptional regulator [Desulfovermiculus halophilus]